MDTNLTPGSAQHLLAGYLDQAALANLLGVTRRTLQRWEQRREGPPRLKVGATTLYKIESVRAWLDGLETKPTIETPRRRRGAK